MQPLVGIQPAPFPDLAADNPSSSTLRYRLAFQCARIGVDVLAYEIGYGSKDLTAMVAE